MTLLFLVGEGSSVPPLAHDRYVALARNETALPEFTGRRFILVEWYLRIVGGQAQDVVSEICAWVVFDAQGRLDLHAALVHEEAAPREAQWVRVRTLVVGSVAWFVGAAGPSSGRAGGAQGLSNAHAQYRLVVAVLRLLACSFVYRYVERACRY